MSEVATTPAVTPGALLSVIASAAQNPAVDVQKMQALLDMQFRLEEREAERSFNQALVRVTTGMPRVKKNGTIELGSKGSIPFARWEDMDEIIRPRLEAEGFVLSFNSKPRQAEGGGAIVCGTLLHRDGHSRTVEIPLPLDGGPGRNSLQAMGSTISYGKRYATEMLLNIVREGQDDDGQSGGARYITEAQKGELIALLQETRTDTATFLRTFEVRSVDEIQVGAFTAAKNMLAAKRAKMGRSA